jgi:DNA (cytosine-5)-methyltransferase 1
MKHLDLFSGYGGFTIPAQKYGIETIGFSEIDKYAIQVLNYHYPNIKNYGDITEIKGEDLPTVDIITGGSPCQDLSVAGKGAGLNGKRSGLFFHFMRLIKEKQPTYFVWENVKGALSSSRGWDFARVQIEMEQAGYDVQWQVINAKDFGVPQNRERIFAIGIRKGSGREILFKRIGSSQNIKTRQQVSSTIHAGYYKQGGRDQQYINKIVNTGHDGTNIFSTDGIAPTQKALGGGQGAKTGLYAVPNSTSNQETLEGMRIRRLTPTECERLMGLEDGWTAKGIVDGREVDISDTQRYKMCGNGVVVNCVDYIYGLICKLNCKDN